MAIVTVEIDTSEIDSVLIALNREIRRKIFRKALQTITRDLKDRLKTTVPVDTGRLRTSIRTVRCGKMA